MKFEYDSKKSASNKKKHGIDFEETQELWEGDIFVAPADSKGEKRYIAIGKIKGKFYSCIFTVRKENIRLISCRRSRDEERRLYHEASQKEDNIG